MEALPTASVLVESSRACQGKRPLSAQGSL